MEEAGDVLDSQWYCNEDPSTDVLCADGIRAKGKCAQ